MARNCALPIIISVAVALLFVGLVPLAGWVGKWQPGASLRSNLNQAESGRYLLGHPSHEEHGEHAAASSQQGSNGDADHKHISSKSEAAKRDGSNEDETMKKNQGSEKHAPNQQTNEKVESKRKDTRNGAADSGNQGKATQHEKSGSSKVERVEDGEGPKETDEEPEPTKEIQMDTGDDNQFAKEYYTCIDDKRVHVDFTNKTCVTRAMLLEGIAGNRPSFYLACGAEAMLRKDVEFKSIDQVMKKLLRLVLYATASGLLPLLLSTLVFQSINDHSKAKKAEYQQVEQPTPPSKFDSCKKFVGLAGVFVFVPVIVCFNLYTTSLTTARVISEVNEFRNTLHYGKGCDFSLYLDYAFQGEILEVLTLAMFSWSDLAFHIAKIIHDLGIILFSCCWGCCNTVQYVFCCKWIPWHLLKTLCCCYGPAKCCSMLWGSLLKTCLIVICILPIFVALICIDIISLLAAAYALAGIFLVVSCYGCVAMVVGAIALCAIYIASLPLQLIMKLVNGREFTTPTEYFESSILAFFADAKIMPSLEKGWSMETFSGIVRSKLFAVLIPVIALIVLMALHICGVLFVSSYTANWVDQHDLRLLNEKVQGSWQQTLYLLWAAIRSLFQSTNNFVYEYLILKIMHIPLVLHTVMEYLDPEVWLVSLSTLLDLGSKFDKMEKAVLALRVGSGLLMGPLRLFEIMAKYDVA